ncbi:hypothetical protein GO988_23645 [Hymenobacter sp. HMF4947]|uniref:Phage major capsid protein n=1 Tax=Hymenobacter ginkgonis TaxID=2682976 RepID=A0A7K1TLV7_9BACT|nr:hypothetical protein [Hymenobacter ginkgonis]MVN79336.1 hypothetical protein [Hymenobacter ginkgonis]
MIDFTGLPTKLQGYSTRDADKLLSQILILNQSYLQYMQLLVDVQDEQALTQMYVDSVIQPGNRDSFTPKGTVKFKNRIGKVRACKIDFKLTPTQITAMWKGYLGRIAKSKRGEIYDVPFQQYIMDMLANKGKEEIHLQAVFKGVYRPDVNTANRVFDGILPLLSDAGIVPAANIFVSQPITQSNAIDQMEGLAGIVPSHLVNTDLVLLCEPTMARFYNLDYRSTFGANTNNTGGFEHKTLDGTNITIIPEPGLADTGGMMITPRENLVWLTGQLNKPNAFEVEKSERNIKIMADFEASADLAVAELVWTTDRTLAKGVALRAAAAAEASTD